MKRRLWLLNFVLLGLVIFAVAALRDRWNEARRREMTLVNQRLTPAPPPALTPIPPVPPSTPAAYAEVAQKMVFVRDRNPNVILDPPAPPPPPKPMPALPVAHGVIDLGGGPTAILSEKPGAPHHGYRPGEMVGQFKVLAMSNQEIVFDWEGQEIRKKLEDLQDRTLPVPAATDSNAPPAPAQQTSTPAPPPKPGPGTSLGNETKACVTGDTSPAGTVVDGMKKVLTKTPFGDSCRWEPAK